MYNFLWVKKKGGDVMIWAIRGAITIEDNSEEAVRNGTNELMSEIISQNKLTEDEVVSIIFTGTKDIDSKYPSAVVREDLGWVDTPMLNFDELDIKNSLKLCIRVMIHINTNKGKLEMKHIYLKNAEKLRPDLAK